MKEVSGWKYKPKWLNDSDSEISWKMFNGENNRISIIYGRNGSGKTTFAEAITSFKEDVEYDGLCCYPFDKNGNQISTLDKNRIFVFDEKFIQEKIGFKTDSDSLNAIVMFGENKNIDKKIEELQVKKERDTDEINAIDIDKYERNDSNYCLPQLENDIKSNLKKNWAIRDKNIKGNQKASSVPPTLFKKIQSQKYQSSSYGKTLNEFNELLARYNSAKKYEEPIPYVPLNANQEISEKLKEANKLLAIELHKPISNELADKIISEIKSNNSGLLMNKTKELIESETNYCPCCFQEVTPTYRLKLKEAFNNVIDKEVNKLRQSLNDLKIQEFNVDFKLYFDKISDADLINKCINCQDTLNVYIAEFNNLLTTKYNNPYAVFEVTKTDEILQSFEIFESAINSINKLIQSFNDAVKNTKAIKITLDQKNLELANIETHELFEKHKKLKEQKISDGNIVANKREEIEQLEKEIVSLRAKFKNTNVALESINSDLKIIFGSDKVIQLYPDPNGNYRITSHNRKVKLSNVSVGERNAISICYFFSLLKQNEKKGEEFSHPLFLVIDDPISSFDRDNKIGVLTILKYNLKKIIKRNEESKCVILTHDLMTADYISKALSGVKNRDTSKLKISRFVINSKKELEIQKDMPQYKSWVQDIFNYATHSSTIGYEVSRQNEMRRILETYFTFNYGKGFDELLNEDKFLNKISDINVREYFETSVFKIGLNSGSHSEDAVKYDDEGPYGYNLDGCTEEEKVQLAKDLLCLLYSLDNLHLIYLLSDKNLTNESSIRTTFNNWLNEIKSKVNKEENL